MELDEIPYNRAAINAKLRSILDEATDKWGVRAESIEIREVEPSPTVKKAMEEQTAAERERRAAILSAEGERMAMILRALGEAQRLRILAAGASALHPAAVTVLGLETLAKLADTPSTKLVLPYELTRLAEAVAAHLGAAAAQPP
ncbi:hypothetical protein Hbut_0739 [Hyperthermus butylicus DSM 5456]|uniref:Band 7 domain-containing protein n=2 Tax=Hyperthermus butylicus TaxID=54248 RepID=A2BKT2_HYPBU|nr:hypothetical protein Hbut_0739 [Hyperthermus butylicus DSM 5456]